MSTSSIPAEILHALGSGVTILTPGQRPARTLRHAYDLHMQVSGKTLWAPPAVFAIDTWLASLYTQLLVAGEADALLLNPTQELSLWRTSLAEDRHTPPLHSPDALATQAREAWQSFRLHNGRNRLESLTSYLHRWARHFDRTCTRSRYLTAADLPAVLEAALARGILPLPDAGVALVDFDRLLPAHERLLHSIALAGFSVQHLASALPSSTAALHTAADQASELRAAADWARDLLTRDSALRIAVVVPDLASLRPRLERVFADVLGQASAPITSLTPPPYEFSLGVPLAQTNLAATALDLLRWALEALSLDRITALLLSPYFGSRTQAEALAIATFDARELRGHTILRPQLTLAEVLRRASSFNPATLSSLTARLRRLQRAAAQLTATPSRRSHAQWSLSFSTLLAEAGWAIDAQADSTTVQLHRRWLSALDELATRDFAGTTDTVSGALDALTRICRNAVFAPESRNAPIQILGPLELGGLPFDALWFLSADDSSWPRPLSANPLIPQSLQRELHLPGADPVADRAVAALLTHRIARTAADVVFSYAAESESGRHRPSPLLRELGLQPLAGTPHVAPPPPHSADLVLDDQPIPAPAVGALRGGATILELQAACAFRAFAEKRLFSAEPEARDPGLDPRERGTVVHEVMQVFWAKVLSQASLRALTLDDRHAIIDEGIEHALRKPAHSAATPWDAAYLDVERRRLRSLLRPWLEEELKRSLFTVSASEHKLPAAQIGRLRLDLRVDRIDIIGDPGENQTAIIDYKTGTAKATQWLTDRPEKPQLPLYAAVSSPPPAGIAFAVLKPGKGLRLESRADSRRIFGSGAAVDFEASLEEWREHLTNLADAFHDGDVRVNPRTYPQTCEHCGQRTLCRLDLTTVDDLSDEEDMYEAEASAE